MKVAIGNKMVTFCDICGNAIALYKPERVWRLHKRVSGQDLVAQNYHVCERCAPLMFVFCELSNLKYKESNSNE